MRKAGARNRVVLTLAVAALGMFALFSGCMTLEQMAPPVEGKFRMIAARDGVDVATLELGRQIYLSDCVKCHSVEPISRYSAKRWRSILPEMALETKLDERQTEAVEAYVMLAHALLEENAKNESEIAGRGESASGASVVDLRSTHGGG